MAEYSVHSLFDYEKHAKTFINYTELVIDSSGYVMYAVPSHQEKLIELCRIALRCSRQELYDMCPQEYYGDFMQWLCNISNCVSVWNDYIVVPYSGVTDCQKQALNKLYEHKLINFDPEDLGV